MKNHANGAMMANLFVGGSIVFQRSHCLALCERRHIVMLSDEPQKDTDDILLYTACFIYSESSFFFFFLNKSNFMRNTGKKWGLGQLSCGVPTINWNLMESRGLPPRDHHFISCWEASRFSWGADSNYLHKYPSELLHPDCPSFSCSQPAPSVPSPISHPPPLLTATESKWRRRWPEARGFCVCQGDCNVSQGCGLSWQL